MKKIIIFLIFASLPLWATAQDYNGEAEAFFLTILIVLAPISFLIGLPIAIAFKRKASQSSDIGMLRTFGWLLAGINVCAGFFWGYVLYFFFVAGGLQASDWGYILTFVLFSLGSFIPAILMYKGEQGLKRDQPTSLKPK